MIYLLGILFGVGIGFALGLTGAGGSIFAVPLLVYALSVPPQEAVGISLAAVGATAAIGMIQRLRRHEVDVRTGLLFAVTGMLGAPLGAWLNSLMPATLLLILFAGLMLLIAARMWVKSRGTVEADAVADCRPRGACRRDANERLLLTSRCAVILSLLGLMTGVLSGLFGVGGGFVIVPVLVLMTGMGVHRAVATSLMVITLVSASGLTSYLVASRPIDFALAGLFALGGTLGMTLGSMAGRRISGPALQKGFSVAIVAVAVFVVTQTLI